MEFINWERLRANSEHHSKCCDLYDKLLGDIKKYKLHPILDWGETYITGFNKYPIRINHSDDKENIMIFHLRMSISKEDKLNEILNEYVLEDEFYNCIYINNLTPNELKNVLYKIFNY